MKFFLFCILLIISLNAEHVQWRADYDTAHQEALQTNKLIMVLLVDDDCVACSKMLEITFSNQPYIKKINEMFVSVIVKKGQQQSYPLEMLYSMTYPTVFFLNKEELFVGKNIFAYVPPYLFDKHLKREF